MPAPSPPPVFVSVSLCYPQDLSPRAGHSIWFSLEILFFPKCLVHWKGPLSRATAPDPQESPAESVIPLQTAGAAQVRALCMSESSPQRVTSVATTVLGSLCRKMGLSPLWSSQGHDPLKSACSKV